MYVITTYGQIYELKSCPKDYPFLIKDNNCSNFSDICLKTTDDECKRLLAACDQCPPSNLTISYLSELIKTAKDTSNSTRLIYQKLEVIFENKFDFSKGINSNGFKSIDKKFETLVLLCRLILSFWVIGFLIMLLEIRYKIITKFCKVFKSHKGRDNEYKFLSSRKHENIKKLLNEKFETLQKQIVEFKDDRSRKIKFTIVGENLFNEFRIHENDSVVFVKDLICTEWFKPEEFYKIMQLKCDDKYLNNNDYLLSQISSGSDTIKCEFDQRLIANDIVVLQMKGVSQRNTFLQVDKKDKIESLKVDIKRLFKLSDFCIYHKKDEMFTELHKDETIGNERHEFKDKDFIYIVFKDELELTLSSIFDETQILRLKFYNTDKIQSIYDKIKNHHFPSDIILFRNSQYIQLNDFIFQYNVSDSSPIKYCKLIPFGKSLKSLTERTKAYNIDDGKVAYDSSRKKNVYVKTFPIPVGNHLKENKALIKELSIFNILKSENKFVKIEEPYIDSKYLYIPMEYMKDGSLKDFLKSRNQNGNYVNESEIKNWSRQIVDALDFLHHNNIIHRNLKTSNILLYENNKLKLSSFGLSKYLNYIEFADAVKGIMQTNYQLSRHLAPEMKGNRYGNKIDIWSFGIVLLEMNNGTSIFPELNDTDAVVELANVTKNEDIKYSLREKTSENFKDFIRCCLKLDVSERSTAEQLKKHLFLNG